MNNSLGFYPDDWNENKEVPIRDLHNNINSETTKADKQPSNLNNAILSALMQNGNLDISKLLSSMYPKNNLLSSILPILSTKKTAKAVSTQSISQNKIDTSKFTNVKDYYK